MRTIQINEAETNFPALLAAVEAGEEIALTRQGRVVARMLPGPRRSPPPRQRWEEAKIALEASMGVATGLLSPLD